MKTRSNIHRDKSGAVLAMVMIVMLLFIILSSGLYKLHDQDAVEAVYVEHSKQAFWAAEAGLQDAIQRLSNKTYHGSVQGSSNTFSDSAGTNTTATYTVTVTDNHNGNPLLYYYSFDVVSVGYKRNMNRRIRQVVETRPGFISAIMGLGNITIGANTIVSGPIMGLQNAKIEIADTSPSGHSNVNDYDLIALSDNATLTQKGAAREDVDYEIIDLPVPDDIPDMPDYSGFYTTNAPGIVTSTNAIALSSLDLSGGTNYYNTPSLSITNVTGAGGVIVNTGDIVIAGQNSDPQEVVSDVALISFGSVYVGNHADFMGNTLIYAFDSIEIGGSVNIAGNSAVLADGSNDAVINYDIIVGQQTEIRGVVFADDGNVKIESGSGGENNTRIIGTVISGNDVELNSNAEVIFNPSTFYSGTLFDPRDYVDGEVYITLGQWKELPPL